MKQIKLFFIIINLLYSTVSVALSSSISLTEALNDPAKNLSRNLELLSVVPEAKATVGVILLYSKEKPYFFLARERIDSNDLKKAGQSYDLGGSAEAENKFSLLKHMIQRAQ